MDKKLIFEEKLKSYQIIRGICCLFICLNHITFFNRYSFGEIGVDYFIIISGLLTALNASKYGTLRNWYLFDKVRKLLPLYWCATIFVHFVCKYNPSWFFHLKCSSENMLYSLFLIPGHVFYVYPSWTLTLFFVFYCVYFFADKLSSKRDIVAGITLCCLISIGAIVKSKYGANTFTYYCSPLIIEFVYGICLFYICKKFHNNKYNLSLMSYILFVLLFFNYNKFLGIRYLVPAILASISVYYFEIDEKYIKVNDLLSKVGEASYVIYILHPFFIRPVDKFLLSYLGNNTSSLLYFLAMFLSVIFCATCCYKLLPTLRKIKLSY